MENLRIITRLDAPSYSRGQTSRILLYYRGKLLFPNSTTDDEIITHYIECREDDRQEDEEDNAFLYDGLPDEIYDECLGYTDEEIEDLLNTYR